MEQRVSGSDDKWEQILRVAARLFAQRGYHGTGMTELGDAAGLQRGALYYYIRSKENLLYEISSRHVAEMVDFGERLAKEERPATDKLLRLSERLIRTIHDDLDEVTVFFREIGALTGERRQRVFELRDRFEEVWMSILQQGVSEGTFRRADPLLIKAVLGMHNYSYLWLRPDGKMQPEEVARYFCELLFRGILTETGDAEYRSFTANS
ncbi:TetR family transcriptional regulator [Amycolatopsis acidiphila]|nr:TetR family transcriptional regulator [Amycolatopsis acidiphila]